MHKVLYAPHFYNHQLPYPFRFDLEFLQGNPSLIVYSLNFAIKIPTRLLLNYTLHTLSP